MSDLRIIEDTEPLLSILTMKTKKFRGIDINAANVEIARNLPSLDDLTDQLKELQSIWNNLSLLGELTNIGADINETRQSFQDLAGRLCNALIDQSLRKVSEDLAIKATNTIDILVRNLFERTADIGFLAMDSELCMNCKAIDESGSPEAKKDNSQRMRDYTSKYTVYDNIIILNEQGKVVSELLGHHQPGKDLTKIASQIQSSHAYWEYYGKLDSSEDEKALYYGWKLSHDEEKYGYIILRFNLQQECAQLFDKILPKGSRNSWIICGAIDESGKTIFSSDTMSLPAGHPLWLNQDQNWCTTQIGLNTYLGCIRATTGYQGYLGPGWRGFALIPLTQAFSDSHSEGVEPNEKLDWKSNEKLIDSQILEIQEQALEIQQQLNRSVWNGNIAQRDDHKGFNKNFGKTLLREISKAGETTRKVFGESLEELLQTYINRLVSEQTASASLAIDLMDRNLYERANDCRWWALTKAFEGALLDSSSEAKIQQAENALKHINSLYTVYTDILLIDKNGLILANSGNGDRKGQIVKEDWLSKALNLRDQQTYTVSKFEKSSLYENRATYIYCAAVNNDRECPTDSLGVIALVFDSEPQFEAILKECAGSNKNALAYIIDPRGHVISATTERWIEDDHLAQEIRKYIPEFKRNQTIGTQVNLDGWAYALGVCHSDSYREYKSDGSCYQNDLTCVYLSPITKLKTANNSRKAPNFYLEREKTGLEDSIEVATFSIDENWYALPTDAIASAIPESTIARIPNSPNWVEGSMIHQGEILTVIDLSTLIGQGAQREKPTAENTLIQLKTDSYCPSVALRVTGLGEIPNIPKSSLQTNGITEINNLIFDSIIRTKTHLILLINPEALLCKIGAIQPA